MHPSQHPLESLPEEIIYKGSELVMSNGTNLSPEIHDFHSEPVIKVTEATGTKYYVPASLFCILNKEYNEALKNMSESIRYRGYGKSYPGTALPLGVQISEMIKDLYRKSETLKRELYNPTKMLGLKSMDKITSSIFTLSKYNLSPDTPLHPVISWELEKKTKKEENFLNNYVWRLSILEIPGVTLGIAKWDNAKDIETLVSQMSNVNALMITLALMDPTKASKYKRKKELEEYSRTPDFKVSEEDLSLIFESDLGLQKLKNKVAYSLTTMVIYNIPVAIIVSAAQIPSRKANGSVYFSALRKQILKTKNINKNKITVESMGSPIDKDDLLKKWLRISKNVAISSDSKWRVVKLENLQLNTYSYCLSKISEETWDSDVIQGNLEFAERSWHVRQKNIGDTNK